MKKKVILLMMGLLLLVTGCEKKIDLSYNNLDINFDIEGNESDEFNYDTDNPTVAMYIEGYGAFVIELYPNYAPNTVNNFISLVKKGFYDKNTIHRAQPGFVVQGGDPTGKGDGGPGYTIKGEFTANRYTNTLKHTKGIVSMARSESYNSAGSQFFVMLNDNSSLDNQYAAFGKVIAGLENIEEIPKKEEIVDNMGVLKNNLTIIKAIVNTKGITYDEPITISE